MKNLLILSCLLLAYSARAEKTELRKYVSHYVEWDTLDASIPEGFGIVEFTFISQGPQYDLTGVQVINSANDKVLTTSNKDGYAKTKVKSDTIEFQFHDLNYVESCDTCITEWGVGTAGYYDKIASNIVVKSQHRLKLVVYLESSINIISDKPVIYLYPEEKMDVSIKLDVNGDIRFAYPKYEDNWSLQVSPGSKLTVDGKQLDYLFWEGNHGWDMYNGVSFDEGFVVASGDLLDFFEEKLDMMNLNHREKQDFITYWVPRMMQEKYCKIRFYFNDWYANNLAELEVLPKAQNLYRMFMVYEGVDAPVEMKEQNIQAANRDGFHVIEWGGSEMPKPYYSQIKQD